MSRYGRGVIVGILLLVPFSGAEFSIDCVIVRQQNNLI